MAIACGLLLSVVTGELLLRLMAHVSPGVAYLATAGVDKAPQIFKSLEEYLASKPGQVVPHRNWFNYWNNSFGLNDQEFTVPKPAGRFRILALGDSFTYGLVPYPHNVMTLLEEKLRAACGERDLDVLNFGVGAARVSDYRALFELAGSTYEPDLVLVNFYLGNDGPDSYRHGTKRLNPWAFVRHSYLWTYSKNVWKLNRSARVAQEAPAIRTGSSPSSDGRTPRGGTVVDPTYRLRDDDPLLVGPTFSEEAFVTMLAEELRRFYVPTDLQRLEEGWDSVLATLETLRQQVIRSGSRFVIALYPSALQIHPEMRSDVLDTLRKRARYETLSAAQIDPLLPNRVILEYCRRKAITCFDLTADFVSASRESAEALYKSRDTHWTIRGNRVAAQAQASQLKELVCASPARGLNL